MNLNAKVLIPGDIKKQTRTRNDAFLF